MKEALDPFRYTDSSLVLNVLSNLWHPLHPPAGKHLQLGLTLTQVNPIRFREQTKLQTSSIRIPSLNDTHRATTLSTHGPLHWLPAASVGIHEYLVNTTGWAHCRRWIGSRVEMYVLLGYYECVAAYAARTTLAWGAMAGECRKGDEGFLGDGDLWMTVQLQPRVPAWRGSDIGDSSSNENTLTFTLPHRHWPVVMNLWLSMTTWLSFPGWTRA